jgi:hypothetical protein
VQTTQFPDANCPRWPSDDTLTRSLLSSSWKSRMNLNAVVAVFALALSLSGAARAEDTEALHHRIDQLESELKKLSARIDNLGSAAASRQIRVVDPVFIGAGSTKPSPLAMDNPIINCQPHSFVTAIQVLKTGNTVSQIRYACRGI